MAKAFVMVVGLALILGSVLGGGAGPMFIGVLLVLASLVGGAKATRRSDLPGYVPPVSVNLRQGTYSVALIAAGRYKIKVIKVVRLMAPGLGLKEAKNLVDLAPTVLLEGASRDYAERMVAELEAVGAAAVVKDNSRDSGSRMASPPSGASADMTMLSAGDREIQVIKVIRELFPALGLKEAKDLADRAPVVLPAVSPERAQEVRSRLEAEGAIVMIAWPPTPPRSEVVPVPQAPHVAAQGLVDLVLVNPGPNSISTRQALKKRLGMDLLEAYEAVEKTPHVLRSGMDRAEASRLKTVLEADGAELEVRESTA